MKKWRLAAAASLIAAVLICLFLVFFPRGASFAQPLRLWYISGDCPDKALEALVSDYNRRAGKQARAVAVQSFEDEAALGAAFETDMPDLLLCSHAKAVQLDSRSVLAKLETGTEVWTQEVSGLEGVGEYFFPLGARVTVLLADTAKCKAAGLPASWNSLEDLLDSAQSYAAASGAPLLAAYSYTAVFRVALRSLSADFDPAAPDVKSNDYVKIYNALTQCAYDGGLSAAASTPGELPCTLAWSTALGGSLPASLSVSLAPLPEGGSEQRPAELLGIAVLRHENEDSSGAAAFISWLCGRERLSKLALDAGLVPVSEFGSMSGSPLLELYDCGKLTFVDIDGGAEQEFDAQFRRTIELLS